MTTRYYYKISLFEQKGLLYHEAETKVVVNCTIIISYLITDIYLLLYFVAPSAADHTYDDTRRVETSAETWNRGTERTKAEKFLCNQIVTEWEEEREEKTTNYHFLYILSAAASQLL